MKMLRITSAIALAVTALLSLGVMTTAAQGPTAVAFLDNQPHTLQANSSALYRFDYAVDNTNGTRPITTIRLVNGTLGGLAFEVWTPDTVTDMADNNPVGRGTAASVDCTTGEVVGSGGCQSPDLTWSGAFGTSATYYVRVINDNNSSANYQLMIQGDGVSLGRQPAGAPSAPAAAPPLTAANADDPNKATAIDGQAHSIPAGTATWYSFNYGVNNDTGEHPIVTIRLANGNNSGVSFQVWSSDSMSGGWWNNNPTGRGTAANVDCDTGEVSGSGGCQSPDLVWSGAFGTSGTFFVRVVNANNSASNITLTIQ
jgi:hypothetical protein